jgi:hypothetical protein
MDANPNPYTIWAPAQPCSARLHSFNSFHSFNFDELPEDLQGLIRKYTAASFVVEWHDEN